MEVSPKDGVTVVLPEVPAGSAYWLNCDSAGSLAEHDEVVAAFGAGAVSVLVVGSDFEAPTFSRQPFHRLSLEYRPCPASSFISDRT